MKNKTKLLVNPPHHTTFLQVEILGEHVDLQWLPERLMNGNFGSSDSNNKQINLLNTQTGIQNLDTLIHEMQHYISDKTNIDLSEHQVHILGMAWSNIFYANPELLGYIAERMAEEDERRIKR
jgi:hypothetical protein